MVVTRKPAASPQIPNFRKSVSHALKVFPQCTGKTAPRYSISGMMEAMCQKRTWAFLLCAPDPMFRQFCA